VWLAPLPDVVPFEGLVASGVQPRPPGGLESLVVPVGIIDEPAHQAQQPLLLDLSGAGGHVACVGSPRTGKTTFLRTLVGGLVTGRPPQDVSVYVVDLGGGGLHDLAALPHVGAVAGRHDPDSVTRLVREMRAVAAERAAAFRACGVTSMAALRAHPHRHTVLPDPLAGEIFLVVDNAGVLRTEFPDLDLTVADLAGTSLQFGIHVVLTANRWLDVRPALLEAIGTRVELHLNDPVDSLVGRRVAETIPADRPGRGVLRDGRQVQVALPPVSLDVAAQAGRHVASQRGLPDPTRHHRYAAPRVLPLPARLTVDEVPVLAAAAGRPVPEQDGFLLGVSEFRLTPQWLDLTEPGTHLLVYGDTGSGKTTLARRAVAHLAGLDGVVVHLVDLSRGLLESADLPAVADYVFTASQAQALAGRLAGELVERLPPPDIGRAELLARSWWSGPDHAVVVDDYDLLLTGAQGPLAALSEALPHARDIGLHVILTRRVAGAGRSFEAFGQRLRELTPVGLLLDGERSEGPLVGDHTAARQPPGRGLLVRRGQPATLVQVAMPGGPTQAPAAGMRGPDTAVQRTAMARDGCQGRAADGPGQVRSA
jgi:S-DNA-T family DNA segregation ATPase FtsK/SpoIIIE